MKEPAICENHLYGKAYSHGRKSVQRHLIVYVLRDKAAKRVARSRRDGEKVNRLGLTVRKNVGGAIERNRVKRILRVGYRSCVAENPPKKGFLIVIVARPSALGVKSTVISREMKEAFLELELI